MGEAKRKPPLTARQSAERAAIRLLFGDNPHKATPETIPADVVFSVNFPALVDAITLAIIRFGADADAETVQ